MSSSPVLLGLTARIVAAHVGHTPLPASALPELIRRVHAALAGAGTEVAAEDKPAAAASSRRTVFPDYLVCLEDGRKLKTLKRHLRTTYGLSPEAYREKWHLPADYPMVAPNYAERRSKLAKALGLGRREAAPPPPPNGNVAPPPEPEPPPAAEPTLSQVFARFPAPEPAVEETAPASVLPSRKRQPFSKQRTRTMAP